MNNTEIRNKIKLIEESNKKLGKEYNDIKKKFEYTKSVLDIRDIEIRNNYKEIEQLKDALNVKGVSE